MQAKSYKNIDDYIKSYPAETQVILKKIRRLIKAVAPQASEDIKYQLPTFILGKNLVHFGAFKNHIGFYPTPSATKSFKKELAKYESGKGSIQFPLDKPIPYNLIKKIVEFRVKENLKTIKKKTK